MFLDDEMWENGSKTRLKRSVGAVVFCRKRVFVNFSSVFADFKKHQSIHQRLSDKSTHEIVLLKKQSSREIEPWARSMVWRFSLKFQPMKNTVVKTKTFEVQNWLVKNVWKIICYLNINSLIYISRSSLNRGGSHADLLILGTFFSKLRISEPGNGFWEL